jgi:hypothetical protein
METKQLRHGTYVIYNGQIGIIKTISNIDSVNIQLKDNSLLSVEKDKLKIIPHNKKELIKYKNIYYIIENISIDDKFPVYHLAFVNSNFNKSNKKFSLKIKSNDKDICSVDKKKQEKTIQYLQFIDRYNSNINYLNKKTGKIFD